jgi:hypothetical protein
MLTLSAPIVVLPDSASVAISATDSDRAAVRALMSADTDIITVTAMPGTDIQFAKVGWAAHHPWLMAAGSVAIGAAVSMIAARRR